MDSSKAYNKITLTFSLNNLFDIAKLRSAQMAKAIKLQDGSSQESNLALTDSDRALWDVGVRYPASAVYNFLCSAGKVSDVGYQYNVSGNIIYTLYLHEDWDKNLARELNDLIEGAIVSGSLADWFKSNLSPDAYDVCKRDYDYALAASKLCISKRKYPTRIQNNRTF